MPNENIFDASLPPTRRPPLGLPAGSVRALLTLAVTGVVISDLVKGNEMQLLWTEAMMMSLAHYFASRRMVELPRELIAKLTAAGQVPSESHPLFLPRHSIRLIILAMFIGVGVYLYRQERLSESAVINTLTMVGAYLGGVVARGVFGFLTRNRFSLIKQTWEDGRAIVTLGCTAVLAGMHLAGKTDWISTEFNLITLGLIMFYFGSR